MFWGQVGSQHGALSGRLPSQRQRGMFGEVRPAVVCVQCGMGSEPREGGVPLRPHGGACECFSDCPPECADLETVWLHFLQSE